MAISNYKDLKVWQKSIDLVDEVYSVTNTFPKNEQFGLTSQLRRAACSIASNIAEGSAKRSKKEYVRFVNIAYGSLAEIETQIIIAQRQGYIEPSKTEKIEAQTTEIGKMLNGLRNSLEN